MFALIKQLKYLPVLFTFRDIKKTWQKEGLNVKTKPFYLSRRFVGLCLVAVAAALSVKFGIKIDEASVQTLAGNVIQVAQGLSVIWGIALGIKGQVSKSIKAKATTKIEQ